MKPYGVGTQRKGTDMTRTIENWSLVQRVQQWGMCDACDPYAPPAVWFWAIHGTIDGEYGWVTSEVNPADAVDGAVIVTKSGSHYHLSGPNTDPPKYVSY